MLWLIWLWKQSLAAMLMHITHTTLSTLYALFYSTIFHLSLLSLLYSTLLSLLYFNTLLSLLYFNTLLCSLLSLIFSCSILRHAVSHHLLQTTKGAAFYSDCIGEMFNVWCLMCDVWCVMWCVMCDVWSVMCGVWCMMCDVRFVIVWYVVVISDVWMRYSCKLQVFVV